MTSSDTQHIPVSEDVWLMFHHSLVDLLCLSLMEEMLMLRHMHEAVVKAMFQLTQSLRMDLKVYQRSV